MAGKYLFSIRYKLLILVLLPLATGFVLYAFIAINWFTKEKKSYIYESSVSVSKSLSLQVRRELEAHAKVVEPIIASIDYDRFRFSKEGGESFMRQKTLEHIQIYQQSKGQVYEKTDHLYLPERSLQNFVPGGETVDGVLKAAAETGYTIQNLAGLKMYFVVAQKAEDPKTKRHVIVISVFKSPDLYESFSSPSAYKNYLVAPNGLISMETKSARKTEGVTIDSASFFNPVFKSEFPFGVEDLVGPKGDKLVVSFAKVGRGGLYVTSVIERSVAFNMLQSLVVRSGLFGLALLSAAAMVSLLASTGFASSLRKLADATRQMAAGNFNISLGIESNDEVHQVADGLSSMAKEVPRLMTEAAEKNRLANNLKTVNLAHDMLFPKAQAKIGPIEIAGFYEPARECGGNWWSYSVIGDEVCVWIGDVSGTGAETLLITSAARAVASIIELVPNVSPSAAMRIVNHAICATALGRHSMTFFLAAINVKTGMMRYACAGHKLPVVIPEKDKLRVQDLILLTEVGGKRLGEDVSAQYTEGSHQLRHGDSVLMYTEGVVHLQNLEKETLGLKRLINLLPNSFGHQVSVALKVEGLKKDLSVHRGGAELADDISLLALRYAPGAESLL